VKRLVPAIAFIGLLVTAGACGSDDPSVDDAATSPTSAPTAPDSAPSAPITGASAFPVTIEHKFGSITIDSEPERVVSIGFADQDWLLALGVRPIAIRDWYGGQPHATWPWAQDELGDAEPAVLGSAELNFEEIAALQPDLIVGVSSGITDADYAKLSQIAPTLAQPGDYIDYGTPWDVATELIGNAVGKPTEAAALVEHVKGLYETARAEHPEFGSATAAVGFYYNDSPGAYASQDSRSRIISDLGFTIPAEFDELAGGSFFFSVSNEDISTLDTDVLIWIVGSDAEIDKVRDIPLRSSLRAYEEGREVLTDELLSGAFSFGSPLSIEYVLEKLVPELALAVDGDRSTAVPSAAAIGLADDTSPTDDTGPTFDADQQAAADAFATVFDSNSAFEDKAEFIAGPDAVRTAAEAYSSAGATMGGISLAPTAVAIEGDTATITYDVLFGTTAAYEDLTETIERSGESWVVSNEKFCGFLTQARVSCP
jgi:iron complex transport system substrate-binding protein